MFTPNVMHFHFWLSGAKSCWLSLLSKLGHFAASLLARSQWEKNPNSDKIITGLEALPMQEPGFVILVLRG